MDYSMADIMHARSMREQFPEHDRKSTLCSNILSERKKEKGHVYICRPWYSERKEQTREI